MEKTAKKRVNKDLTEEEIAYYLNFLSENVTEYDCGALCSDKDGPYCCTVDHAIPLLFKAEYTYFSSKGNLWYPWVAQTEDEKEIEQTARRDQLFCDCGGAARCKRDQRSISCRTFPLEPYIDRRGVFVGLTYLYDFTLKDEETGKVKCPLTRKKRDIRQAFVDSNFVFWEKLMLRLPDEYEVYVDSSKDLRKKRDKQNYKIEIFYPTWHQKMKSVREYL